MSVKASPAMYMEQFRQQNLTVYEPCPPCVRMFTYVFGCIAFSAAGYLLHTTSASVVEHVIDYTECKPPHCTFSKEFHTGMVEFTVDRDMVPPIWIYYQLGNFHQNQRRYVNSRDKYQLSQADNPKLDPLDHGACHPWIESNDQVNYPCGLIARSVFNDTYAFMLKEPRSNVWQPIHVDSSAETIAWDVDVDIFNNVDPEAMHKGVQYQALMNMWMNSMFPPVECKHIHINDIFKPAHVSQRPLTHSGQKRLVADCGNYMRHHPHCNFQLANGESLTCAGEYERTPVKEWGLRNGHFIVWMRVASLTTFRKLWGKVDIPLKANSTVKFFFEDNFPVHEFQGTKAIVVSTANDLIGGRNDFFATGYMAVTILAAIFAVFELYRDRSRPFWGYKPAVE